MIGPTNPKNCLTFGGDLVPDTDSGLLFHFPHHCGIGTSRRFISISHTLNLAADFYDTRRNDWRQQLMNPQDFATDPADIRIRIRINPETWIRIKDHFS